LSFSAVASFLYPKKLIDGRKALFAPILLSLIPVIDDIDEFFDNGVITVDNDLVGVDWGVTLKRGGERDLVRLF
jgi:hypothetical protein